VTEIVFRSQIEITVQNLVYKFVEILTAFSPFIDLPKITYILIVTVPVKLSQLHDNCTIHMHIHNTNHYISNTSDIHRYLHGSTFTIVPKRRLLSFLHNIHNIIPSHHNVFAQSALHLRILKPTRSPVISVIFA